MSRSALDRSGTGAMGLRERKAARTRAAIIDAARRLFDAQGYHHTTMEQIADAAEVGESTLYRYFPQKELILIEPLAEPGRLATLLEERPEDEALDEALGATLLAFLDGVDSAETRPATDVDPLREVGARHELITVQAQERTALEQAIARRAGVDPTELWVVVAARITITVGYLALERAIHEQGSPSAYAREIVGMLSVTLPEAAAEARERAE